MPTINAQRLTAYLDAERKILAGQAFRYGDRQWTRADLSEVRAEINRLQVIVARENNRGGRFGQADFGGYT